MLISTTNLELNKEQKIYKLRSNRNNNIHPGNPKGLPDDYFLYSMKKINWGLV